MGADSKDCNSQTQLLGYVAAKIVSATAPGRTDVLWFKPISEDTYDVLYWNGSVWISIIGGGVGAGVYAPDLDDSVAMPEAVGGYPAGTLVSDLRNSLFSSLWDQLLFSPQAPTLSPYVKIDGSTPFTAPQAGIDPTLPAHLVTLSYYEDNLSDAPSCGVYVAPVFDGLDVMNISEAVEIQGTNAHTGSVVSFDLTSKVPSGLTQEFATTPTPAVDQWSYFTAVGNYMAVRAEGLNDFQAVVEVYDASTGVLFGTGTDPNNNAGERVYFYSDSFVTGRRYYWRTYSVTVNTVEQNVELSVAYIPLTELDLNSSDFAPIILGSSESSSVQINSNLPANQFLLNGWQFKFTELEHPYTSYIVTSPNGSNPYFNIFWFTSGAVGRSYCVQTRPRMYYGPSWGEFGDGKTIRLIGPQGNVKSDGTVPFTAPQAGIDPTLPEHLVTLKHFEDNSYTDIEITEGYGLLYNWYAATDARGVAPSGFRVPTQTDNITLFNSGDSNSLKSNRVVSDGDPYWEVGAGDNTSQLGLNPAGARFTNSYLYLRSRYRGWSTTVIAATTARGLQIDGNSDLNSTPSASVTKITGQSIRCVSDTEPATTLVQDNDGNNYSWVLIGTQYWLVQSLKTTTYNNGDAIVTGLDNAAWAATTDGAWAYPNGDTSLPIGNVVKKPTLDDSNLIVSKETDLQAFAESVDHNILKPKGTGVSSSYECSVVSGGTDFTHGAVNGEIKSDQGYFDNHYLGAAGVTVVDLSAPSTFVYIDKDLVLQQQTSIPTAEDWVRKMFTMRIAVNTSTNQVVDFEYLNNPIGNYANTIRTVFSYLIAAGVPFKKDMVITGRATDLGFNISAGSFLEFGGTGNIFKPHEKEFPLVDNVPFFLATATSYDAGGNTNLPKFWNNNGVLTALGSTTCVGHRVYRFSGTNANVVLQYGEGNYANTVLCKAGMRLEDFHLNPILKNATFLGWWIIEETATNTGGTILTEFVEYTIGSQGGISSGLSGALLRGNDFSDVLNVVQALINLGILSTAAEINYLIGLTGPVQDQIDALPVSVNGEPPVAGDVTLDLDDIPDGAVRQIYTESDAEDAGKKGGTSFPVTPSDYQHFFRTDIGEMFYYDFSRGKWLSTLVREVVFYDDETSASTATTFQLNHSSLTGAGNSTKHLFGDWTLVGVCVGNQAANSTGTVRLYTGTTGAGTDIYSQAYADSGVSNFTPNVDVPTMTLKAEITPATVGINKPEVVFLFRKTET